MFRGRQKVLIQSNGDIFYVHRFHNDQPSLNFFLSGSLPEKRKK